MLARLAHVVARHRWKVIAAWIVLTLFGAFAAGQVSKRWYQSFSIPGKSAYEANQRTLKTFGTGVRPPDVVVFHTTGDATKSAAIEAAMKRAAAVLPGSRTSSYFSTHNLMYVSKDRHTTFEEVYPAGPSKFDSTSKADRGARRRRPRSAVRDPGRGDGTRSARRGEHARRGRRERPRRGGDRRPRRARDPALRLRHAAGDPRCRSRSRRPRSSTPSRSSGR